MSDAPNPTLIEAAAQIASAYMANNTVASETLPGLIRSVHQALATAGKGGAPDAAKPEPAVPVKKSVTADYIVCLEDGEKFQTLKRHLMAAYQMTPAQYRERWDLPPSYPMVAPNYAEWRSALAKSTGLGRKAGWQAAPPRVTRS